MAMYNFTNVPKHMCNTTGGGRNIKHQLLIEGGVKALLFLTGFTCSPRNTLNPTVEALS